MNKKYVIKNCISYEDGLCVIQDMFCQDCTYCNLKQIVTECYEQENLMEGLNEQDIDFQYYYGRYVFAREILHLLDIHIQED